MTDEKLEWLVCKAKVASPGPWTHGRRGYKANALYDGEGFVRAGELSIDDARFIAAADPETVLKLVRLVRRLRRSKPVVELECACTGLDIRKCELER